MATTISKRNSDNSREINNPFLMELNEAVVDVSVKTSPYQYSGPLKPKEISYSQELNNQEGSITSLPPRTYLDQSDIQLLTDYHLCRYDDCTKFNNKVINKEESENPFSPVKSALFYIILISFFLWIAIYVTLNLFKIV